MVKKIGIINYLAATVVALSTTGFLAGPAAAANLSNKDKQFLAAYDRVHAALVAGDLVAAKAAAADLGNAGSDLAKSNSLNEARDAFEKLSAHAEQLTSGRPGYHVFHCPMLNKDWVQTSTTTANPYGGKDMVACGQMQK